MAERKRPVQTVLAEWDLNVRQVGLQVQCNRALSFSTGDLHVQAVDFGAETTWEDEHVSVFGLDELARSSFRL